MQQKIQLRIDISNDNINPFKVTQYDNMARALEITLINNGIAFTDYTGVTSIIVAFKKNDNKCVTQTVEIPVKGQPIIVPLKAQTLSTPGVLYGQLSLLGANQEKLGTGKFVGTVGEDLAQNAIESSNDWGDLQKAIDLIKNADKFNADENTRKTNEDLRIKNENTRIANERDRDVSFKQSQLQHENAFEASEIARQNTFNTNESKRASNDIQIRNQMAELLKVTGATGTAETELLGARVDKSGKVYANIGSRFDSLDSQLEDNALNSIETDASLTKLNSVVDGNLIVDRMQGRTLVNLWTPGEVITSKPDITYPYFKTQEISLVDSKPTLNRTVTVLNPTERRVGINIYKGDTWQREQMVNSGNTTITLTDDCYINSIIGYKSNRWEDSNKNDLLKIMILDGEYTGSMPAYFKGMKSVGEDNQNKIEISTCGKNLLDDSKIYNFVVGGNDGITIGTNGTSYVLENKFKIGDIMRVSIDGVHNRTIMAYSNTLNVGEKVVKLANRVGDTNTGSYTIDTTSKYLILYLNSKPITGLKVQVELTNITPYEPYKEDKSEIPLLEPLREFDYICKDRVHRKTFIKEISELDNIGVQSTNSNGIVNYNMTLKNAEGKGMICNMLKRQVTVIGDTTDEGFLGIPNELFIRLKCTTLGCQPTDDDIVKLQKLKTWLQTKKSEGNPLTIVYETATETIEPLNESLILSSFKDGYFGLRSGAINPVVSLSFPTTIGGRVDSLEESNYQLKKDYYSTLKILIKTADDCLKLELSKQNKTDNSLTTASKEIVGSINELNNNKVDKVAGKGLSTNDYDNTEKQEVAKVKELEKYIESLQNDIIPPSMNSNKYRYVRCSATGNTQSGNYVSYSEIKVMDGNTNIAFGCNVIDVLGTIDTGMIKYVTDGKSQKDDPSSSLDLIPSGVGGVTVDLGFPQSFQKIIVYHWVGESRKYNNVKVEVSLNKSKWVTLFNSSTDGGDYIETYEGKTVEVPQNDINEVIKYNNYCTERLPDNKNNKLRVATFNMHGDNYLNFDAYKNYVTKNLLHFIGLQEVETTKGAIENKFNIYDLNKVVYGRSSTVNVYNAIHSNRSLETPVVTNLPGTGEGRILVKSSTILNGKKVSLYVTHLSYTEASNRPLQMAKIKEIMDADTTPYKILMGDFNATANDFYNLLGSNYTSIQGYQGNWHETNLDDVYKSIDNIFITKNITINKVVLNPNMMGSDHRMLWAELTLN